jgi:hypothetical protein
VDISELALRAQVAWFRGLAAGGFPQISAGDGFAVSTGLDSNTENGAVIAPSVLDNPHELDALLVWLREKAVPASVLVTGPPEPEATARLIDRGLEPERTGNNMGRLLAGFDPDAARPLSFTGRLPPPSLPRIRPGTGPPKPLVLSTLMHGSCPLISAMSACAHSGLSTTHRSQWPRRRGSPQRFRGRCDRGCRAMSARNRLNAYRLGRDQTW